MNNIPKSLRDELAHDPYYKQCARRSSQCDGRITWEHALIYAGKQVQERFAIIPLCWYHHLGAGMVKWVNELIALRRATPEDFARYPRANWDKKLKMHELRAVSLSTSGQLA